jgi:amino acid transporter
MAGLKAIRRFLFGAPIATKRAHLERLSIPLGLAVFASDNISSVAYATEEILRVLALAGSGALGNVVGISLAIVVLVAIVVTSYTRAIYAYPDGAGDYRVASANLGSRVGRVAGAALVIDYTLTVAVSVSSGVLAIVSAMPHLSPYRVDLALAAVAFIALINLRGLRESGMAFALPVYTFIFMMLALLGYGTYRILTGEGPLVSPAPAIPEREPLGAWLILRAFAAGCVALTGIEAIANGVAAFREPASYNASRTLWLLAAILGTLFLGVGFLSVNMGVELRAVEDPQYRTVVAQIALGVFGESFWFYLLQIATMVILILAANTAFADFPRLCSFIAQDGFLPRQLANLGDRLVFQNGIILLALVSGGLIYAFKADVHALIPLYALGVFTAFTLGQAGMVVRQWKVKAPLWAPAISFVGMLTTGTVWVIILVTKFTHGAYLVVIAFGILLVIFAGIRRHYNYLARSLTPVIGESVSPVSTTVLVLVPQVHRGILHALSYARTLGKDIRALHVAIKPEAVEKVKREWDQFVGDIPLVILDSPYRSLVDPIMEYIDEAVGEKPDHMLTVVVPQAVPKYWWHRILHNNAAIPIKMALGSRKNVVVTDVRYFLE